MPTETLPDRTSNAGPDSQDQPDWRDLLYVAEDTCKFARRIEIDDRFAGAKQHRNRIAAIDAAMEALQNAKELLCR